MPLFNGDEEKKMATVVVAGAALHALVSAGVGSCVEGQQRNKFLVIQAFNLAAEFIKQAEAL